MEQNYIISSIYIKAFSWYIEDIYSFAVNTINIVIEWKENISIFTSAKHEWKFECFHYTRWKFLWYSLKRVNFLFILLFTRQCAFLTSEVTSPNKTWTSWRWRSVLNVYCWRDKKQKVSANQNSFDTIMFLTFSLRKCIPTLDSLVQKQRS